jgi:hypothetical protein
MTACSSRFSVLSVLAATCFWGTSGPAQDTGAHRREPRSRRGGTAARGRRTRRDSELAVDFDTKIAIVLDEKLAIWQKANVTAFPISGIVATDPALVGEPYIDGTGNRYLPMCRQPILIYAADRSGLRRAYERAMARNVEQLAIFTHDLFSTPHDQANRAAVAAIPAADLDLAGIALHANRRTVDKALDKIRPHP